MKEKRQLFDNDTLQKIILFLIILLVVLGYMLYSNKQEYNKLLIMINNMSLTPITTPTY